MKISIFDLPLILTREGLLSFFVRFDFYQKNNQTGFKKKKTKTSSNRPVSVWFGDFRTKTSSNQFFRFGSVFLGLGSVFSVSGL
jgi:hypothetical protein